jgi:hypothetical protein
VANRLRVYLILAIGFAGLSAAIGLSYAVFVPHTPAEPLEEVIRDAKTPGEVRSRIVEDHKSSTVHRLLLYVLPGLATAIMVALDIYNLVKRPDNAATGGQRGTAAEGSNRRRDGSDVGPADR